jgi:predicted transcriptional regulator
MYGAEKIKTRMISVFKAMTPDLISQIAKSQNGIEIIIPQKMPRRIIEKYPCESE